MRFRAELHVHTVLSPCADVEMIPPFIIQTAQEQQIDLIAITDHNATANIPAVMEAAAGSGITVLPGMELQTREEVHLLCLFNTYEQACKLQSEVDRHLPDTPNDTDHFGEQFVVDSTGDFLRREDRMLINSTSMSLENAVASVHSIGGLAIPAHINRRAFGLMEVLGFIPPEIPFDAVELSRHVDASVYKAAQRIPIHQPIIQSGDVHRLDEFLGILTFEMQSRSISEISMALNVVNGRNFRLEKSN
jgi:predicted metal-dependent phosphoesterase TrpH